MIVVLLVVVIIKGSIQDHLNQDNLEELFADKFAGEATVTPSTVSPVAQYYTTAWSNFTEVTMSDFFVDKSLLVKELLDAEVSSFLEISAAPHFGKSTNLDMFKRFLEITVDERGKIVSAESSVNYNTFTRNNLEIAKQKSLIHNHFGKYPVISIHYRPLETVTKFDFLLKRFRVVLFETFSQFKYLLHADDFWSRSDFCKDDFVKYVHEESYINLNKSEIEEGFIVLIDTISKYFQSPVVVLVDDYDIIVDAPVSENCRDEVYNFIVDMNNRIIDSKSVNRVILTGSLLRGGIPYSPKVKSALGSYPHLLKYYGLNQNELSTLLGRYLKNITEVEDAINIIENNYSGYVRSFEVYDEMKWNPRQEIVCSVWSVVQYLTCVRKINIGNIGESDPMSLTYLCIEDRARLIKPTC